jgi:hypothetical protein
MSMLNESNFRLWEIRNVKTVSTQSRSERTSRVSFQNHHLEKKQLGNVIEF